NTGSDGNDCSDGHAFPATISACHRDSCGYPARNGDHRSDRDRNADTCCKIDIYSGTNRDSCG
ncbi:MAG: hypothetical protein ABJB69_10745, partial [Spartobacteria bacterium]